MKSLRCRLGHHDWEKPTGYVPGWAFVFNLRCLRCGVRVGDAMILPKFRPQIETTGKVLVIGGRVVPEVPEGMHR